MIFHKNGKNGKKWSKMVKIDVFGHFLPFWAKKVRAMQKNPIFTRFLPGNRFLGFLVENRFFAKMARTFLALNFAIFRSCGKQRKTRGLRGVEIAIFAILGEKGSRKREKRQLKNAIFFLIFGHRAKKVRVTGQNQRKSTFLAHFYEKSTFWPFLWKSTLFARFWWFFRILPF